MVPISESELQRAVVDLAHLLGWRVAHFRPAPNGRGGWATAVSADGAGFPDLVLARGGQIVFAELKTKTGRLRPDQIEWLVALGHSDSDPLDPNIRVYIWRPDDWFSGRIQEVLK